MRIIRELRERRLVQIVLSYAGGLWVILEVLDQLTGQGLLPDLVYRIVLIWGVMGVAAAVLVGWFHGEKGRQSVPAGEFAALLLIAVLATAASGITVTRHRAAMQLSESADDPLALSTVAVRYFSDHSADSAYQYLADGLTEDLIVELARVDALDVISRNGSATFRGLDVPSDSVGRALGAGTVIEGSVTRRGDRVRLDLAVVDSRSGAVFQRASLEQPLENLLSFRDSVVHETARLLRGWIGSEIRVRHRADDVDRVESWMLVQQAEKLRKQADAAARSGAAGTADEKFDEADRLLARAETLDMRWPEPPIQRGAIAYQRSRLAAGSPAAAELIAVGIEHAEHAIRRSRTSARALELRGTLRYWKWLLQITPDPAVQEALLRDAGADLEAAVRYERSLASAHATLSHYYYQKPDVASAVVAAQRAYDEDAYLEVADLVLWRLFGGSLDMGNWTPAIRACAEGARRFPEHYRFQVCQIRLMATPAVEPDVDQAWRLLAAQDSLAPEHVAQFEHVKALLTIGAVIARAGDADSARAVLDRAGALVAPELDPNRELLLVEAYSRMLLGERERAIDLVVAYEAAVPGNFSPDGAVLWWWRPLQGDPRFQAVLGRS